MGSKAPTTTSTTTIPPQVLAQYQNVINRANTVADTPYTPYTGQLTAGLNNVQGSAITGLAQSAGLANPYVMEGSADARTGANVAGNAGQYFGQGAQGLGYAANYYDKGGAGLGAASPYFQQGANAISGANPYYQQAASYAAQSAGPVNPLAYMNPYTQSVINTTLDNIQHNDAVAQNGALGTAIKSGNAFGGDRAGVAAAELARGQGANRDATIASLQNQGFNTSLAAAQADAVRQGQAAQTYAGLGNSQITAGLGYGQLGIGVSNNASAYGQLGQGATANALGYNQIGSSVVNQGQTLSGIGTQQAGIGQNYQTGAINANNAALAGGTSQEQTDQTGLNAAYQQYANAIAFPYQQTGWLSNISTGIGSGSGGTTTSVGSAPNIGSQILGGGLALGSLSNTSVLGAPLAAMFSDERLKDDKREIGKTFDGQPIYSYRYKGDPRTQIGLMAQDVERDHPEAVGQSHGFKTVDYAAATDEAAQRGKFMRGGVVPERASGGAIGAGFPMAGYPVDFSGVPGGSGGGLIPQITINQAKLNAPAMIDPNKGQSTGIDPKAIAGLSNGWLGQSRPTGGAATSAMGDPTGIGGLYARGGLVANPEEVARGAPMEFHPSPHDPGSGRPASIGTIGMYARGGLVPHGYAPGGLAFASGGLVPRGYANGGDGLDFDDRMAPAVSAIADGTFDPVGANSTTLERPSTGLVPMPGPRPVMDEPFRLDGSYHDTAENNYPMSPERAAVNYRGGDMEPGLGAVTAINKAAGVAPGAPQSSQALSYDGGNGPTGLTPPNGIAPEAVRLRNEYAPVSVGLGAATGPREDGTQSAGGLLGKLGMTEDNRQALLSLGLGLLASKSPNFGVALGEAGQGAMGTLNELNKQRAAQSEKDRQYQLEVQRLNQSAEAARRAALNQNIIYGPDGKPTFNKPLLDFYSKKKELEDDKVKPGVIGYREDGTPINGFIDSTHKKYFLPGGQVYTPPAETAQPPVSTKPDDKTPYNYSRNAPTVGKGLDVPPPAPISGRSPETIQAEAEYYLQTGQLKTPAPRSSSVNAIQQQNYRNSVVNYANTLAASRGMTPAEIAESWRTAPAMTKFILGPDGRSTVALGTATRHLDTLEKYIDAYNASDTPRLRQLQATLSREFGYTGSTNIDSVAAIVGPEIVKAIGVAGAGTADERGKFEHMFQQGTAQSKDAIGAIKSLLQGQLVGKERQAREVGVSSDRFKRLIGEDEYNKLSHADNAAGTGKAQQGAGSNSVPAPAERKVGTVYQTPRGPMTWMGNGWKQ